MKHTKSYKILIFLLLTAFFHGCIDDPVGEESTIEGTVYDQYGMYNPYVLISAGDYPIVSADNYGHFTIENSTYPYNLTVTSRYSFSDKYIGLTLPVTQIYSLDGYGYSREFRVNVEFPPLQTEYDQAIIKFISKDVSTQFDFYAYYGTHFDFHLGIKHNETQIEGKLIFLQFKYFRSIISYEKFGIKDVLLNGNQTIVFTEEDINYNPMELYSTYNLQLSSEFTDWNSNAEMSFTGMDQNSNIRIYSLYENYYSSTFVLPELPMLNYKVKFKNNAVELHEYLLQPYSQQWCYIMPGEDISMVHNKELRLQFPPDGETNVNDNTKFIFSDINPGGVYIYKISSPNWGQHIENIITDKYTLSLKDFKSRGYQFESNTVYYWGVIKYPGYKDINDFASSNILIDTLSTEIPASEWFSFTTQ